MLSSITGLTAGLTIAYLSAPQRGKATRDKLVSFTHDKWQLISRISAWWPQTVTRAKQAWKTVKEATGFWPSQPVFNNSLTTTTRITHSSRVTYS